MKVKWILHLSFLAAILVAVLSVVWNHDRQMQRLTPQEKEAMEFLPEGSVIVVVPPWPTPPPSRKSPPACSSSSGPAGDT